ncbi:hypothetical protein RhiirA4_472688 [Rhizophagus irregularis]|uniref:Uncharacterized protein n=1 Tax=Rhizophagus irregularis TaxID=588596 RepID=A0A2I1H5B6_9GLOM|nr:hypothetical protein RhiirA4_472688 [Rhizophagus irregularis]
MNGVICFLKQITYLTATSNIYGIGTSVNKQESFKLYQQTADLGNMYAQYNLGDMYERRDGIEKDINKAIY